MSKNIAITKPEPPSSEEHHRAALAWHGSCKHCFYTSWPQQYKDLSFKTNTLELTKQEIDILLESFDGGMIKRVRDTSLPARITEALLPFEEGTFIKLESRSPKDNYWGEITNFRRCTWQDVIQSLYSERILGDLIEYKYLDEEPCRMLFREWQFINKHEEFRCFIRGKKLVGITQYFYSIYNEADGEQQNFISKKLIKAVSLIEKSIQAFIERDIIPHMPSDNLVVDLWFHRYQEMKLIEINPYGLSDPCLLNYTDMNGENYYAFKYNINHDDRLNTRVLEQPPKGE